MLPYHEESRQKQARERAYQRKLALAGGLSAVAFAMLMTVVLLFVLAGSVSVWLVGLGVIGFGVGLAWVMMIWRMQK